MIETKETNNIDQPAKVGGRLSLSHRKGIGTATIAMISSLILIVAGIACLAQQLQLRHSLYISLSTQAEIQDFGTDIQVYALQCRRYEKDYFLNIDNPTIRAEYLEKWRNAWDGMSLHFSKLKQQQSSAKQTIDIPIDDWKEDAQQYKQAFLGVVADIDNKHITTSAQANEALNQDKNSIRRIINATDEVKEEAEQVIESENSRLMSEFRFTIVLTMCLMFAPAILIILGQFLYNRQKAAMQQKLVEQNEALQKQENENRTLAAIARITDNSVVVCNTDHQIVWVNDSFYRIHGLSAEQTIGLPINAVLGNTPAQVDAVNQIGEDLAKGKNVKAVLEFHNAAGKQYWIDLEARPIHGRHNEVTGYVAIQRDVTQQKFTEDTLYNAARSDRLTSLPNRTAINEQIKNAIEHTQQGTGGRFALLFLDFDRFKIINDSLGHDIGDMLLIEIANRLRAYIRACDAEESWTPARLGGDEFVLLMHGVNSMDTAKTHANQLLETLADCYNLAGNEVRSTASIGIVLADEHYHRAEDVIRDADTAMYRAKAGGKARAVPFDRDMLNAVQARQKLETDLHHAVERGELTLEYQPIVSLETGAVHGFEALVRWDHTHLGRVNPSEFIFIAEETGLIIPIGNWVLKNACEQITQWRRQYPDVAWSMSINVSGNQLMHPKAIEDIRCAIEASDAKPEWIQLEISEAAISRDLNAAKSVLNELKTIGVKIVMDDFGEGQSSLHHLQELPLDMLKIDKSFVSNLETNMVYPALIQSIATLSHNMGIDLVAEGIESPNQVAHLQALDCELAQGYLFAHPMTAEKCIEFINRSADKTISPSLRQSA